MRGFFFKVFVLCFFFFCFVFVVCGWIGGVGSLSGVRCLLDVTGSLLSFLQGLKGKGVINYDKPC